MLGSLTPTTSQRLYSFVSVMVFVWAVCLCTLFIGRRYHDLYTRWAKKRISYVVLWLILCALNFMFLMPSQKNVVYLSSTVFVSFILSILIIYPVGLLMLFSVAKYRGPEELKNMLDA